VRAWCRAVWFRTGPVSSTKADAEQAVLNRYRAAGFPGAHLSWAPDPVDAARQIIDYNRQTWDHREQLSLTARELFAGSWHHVGWWAWRADTDPFMIAQREGLRQAADEIADQAVEAQNLRTPMQTKARYNMKRRVLNQIRTFSNAAVPIDGERGTRSVPVLPASKVLALYLPDACVLIEPPVIGPLLDLGGNVHSETGPFIQFPSGWSLYAWQGRLVRREVIEAPQELTAKDIRRERNAEVRRVMLERFGHKRFLDESGARLRSQDTDQQGHVRKLWFIEGPRARSIWQPPPEGTMFLEVTNSTPEPDGHYKSYFLRVPPDMRTPKEAAAWTFQLQEHQYEVAKES